MDMFAAIGALKGASEIVKQIMTADRALDQAALKLRMAEVLEAVAEARSALIDVKQELADRDDEIAKLKATFAQAAELKKLDGGYSYVIGDNGQPLGAPICPKCHVDGAIMQMVQAGDPDRAQCPKCQQAYTPVDIYLSSGETVKQKRSRERSAAMVRLSRT